MNSDIKVYRTNELDDKNWAEICQGYKECFNIIRTPEQLKKSFSKTITGFTLHALKFNEIGEIIGHNYYQPRPYLLDGTKVICALSGGTFVLPNYRKDIFIFNEMIKALDKEAANLGWIAQLGVPNENSFKYAVKINKQKHIGDLSYYILPIHIGTILNKNSPILNYISSLFCHFSTLITKCLAFIWNPTERLKPLHLDISKSFLDIRFDTNNYTLINKRDLLGVYRIFNEQGIKTAYIVFCGEKFRRSAKSLNFVVREILRKEHVDAILYIGTMNFWQGSLIKVPKRFVPQKMPLCVTIFERQNSSVEEIFKTIKNIDFGLINYDVR